ncbi:hypothetical protein IMZ48_13285 [Candidatus Bathyarchaeota archaeon]|nr:hypothetical protein [Candidatus Bathyarchaeota archaeon]
MVLVHLVEDVVDGGALDLVFVVRVSEELLAGAELGVLVEGHVHRVAGDIRGNAKHK